jgi:phosphorylcholine metabolism protein LicD
MRTLIRTPKYSRNHKKNKIKEDINMDMEIKIEYVKNERELRSIQNKEKRDAKARVIKENMEEKQAIYEDKKQELLYKLEEIQELQYALLECYEEKEELMIELKMAIEEAQKAEAKAERSVMKAYFEEEELKKTKDLEQDNDFCDKLDNASIEAFKVQLDDLAENVLKNIREE